MSQTIHPRRIQAAGVGDHHPKYCPFCGHALAQGMTVPKTPRNIVMFCPPQRLRLSFFGSRNHFQFDAELIA